MKLLALISKELLVLRKDWHGLLVLFVMPAIFILIMSLAMRDTLDDRLQIQIEYLLIDQDHSTASIELSDRLAKTKGFVRIQPQEKGKDIATLQHLVATDQYKFFIHIPTGFSRSIKPEGNEDYSAEGRVKLIIAPTATPQLQSVFQLTIKGILNVMQMSLMIESLPISSDVRAKLPDIDESVNRNMINSEYVYSGTEPELAPTSVQQSVPAWLVFAMFFVVIPLSTAFIIERQQGSLLRLRIMNISGTALIIGKIVPYYLINQIQMVLMILVGIYLVPKLGGDSLVMGDSLAGLLLISSATSLAAISYALFITAIAKTHVQATTLGGVSNIIFAALGGVMVPKFVMPPFMQELTNISPMSWGLEGFLDIFLRNSSWHDVIPETLALLLFAAISLAIASLLFSRNK